MNTSVPQFNRIESTRTDLNPRDSLVYYEDHQPPHPHTSPTFYQAEYVPHKASTDPQIYLAATESSGGNPFFKADPGLVLWTWVVFALTLLTLYKFAWKPILKMLDERENRIHQALETAKQTEQAAKQTAEQSEKILAEARASGQVIIDDARRAAEILKVKMEQDTKNSLKTMTDKAEAAIHAQQEHAKSELKAYSIELSLNIAGKLIEENIDPAKNEELAKKYLNELK